MNHGALLLRCRDLVAGRVRRAMSGMVNELSEALCDRAFDEGGDIAESPHFDAVREIHLRRHELVLRFETHFARLFDAAVRSGQGTVDLPPADADPAGACRAALLALDTRISALSPALQPRRLQEAFRLACEDTGSAPAVREALVEIFDRFVERELDGICAEANRLIESATPEDVEGSRATNGPGRAFLQRLLGARAVPHFIRGFLLEQWALLLDHIAAEQGEGGSEWDRAVKTAEDLIDAVQEAPDGETRRRIIWGLPGLVHRLRRGMRRIPMTLHEQMLFLRTLRAHHLRMVGLRSTAGMLDS